VFQDVKLFVFAVLLGNRDRALQLLDLAFKPVDVVFIGCTVSFDQAQRCKSRCADSRVGSTGLLGQGH